MGIVEKVHFEEKFAITDRRLIVHAHQMELRKDAKQ
jgi:hypothetical protein